MNFSEFINISAIEITGIDEIDTQHKKIAGILNKLYEIIIEGQSEEIKDVKTFMDELDFYTIEHFDTEDFYMSQYNYPKIEDHKAAHNYFKTTCDEIKNNYYYQKNSSSSESNTLQMYIIHLFLILKDWIKLHLETYDAELAEFLRGRESL